MDIPRKTVKKWVKSCFQRSGPNSKCTNSVGSSTFALIFINLNSALSNDLQNQNSNFQDDRKMETHTNITTIILDDYFPLNSQSTHLRYRKMKICLISPPIYWNWDPDPKNLIPVHALTMLLQLISLYPVYKNISLGTDMLIVLDNYSRFQL